jgi:hypothetical protein
LDGELHTLIRLGKFDRAAEIFTRYVSAWKKANMIPLLASYEQYNHARIAVSEPIIDDYKVKV